MPYSYDEAVDGAGCEGLSVYERAKRSTAAERDRSPQQPESLHQLPADSHGRSVAVVVWREAIPALEIQDVHETSEGIGEAGEETQGQQSEDLGGVG